MKGDKNSYITGKFEPNFAQVYNDLSTNKVKSCDSHAKHFETFLFCHL